MLHCGCVWLGIDSRCLWLWLWLWLWLLLWLWLWLWLWLLLLQQGATYSNTGGNACYAEFGMTDSNGNSTLYVSLTFDVVAICDSVWTCFVAFCCSWLADMSVCGSIGLWLSFAMSSVYRCLQTASLL